MVLCCREGDRPFLGLGEEGLITDLRSRDGLRINRSEICLDDYQKWWSSSFLVLWRRIK